MYPVCSKIKPCDHVCHLYVSHAEHVKILTQFCLDGLKENGKVLCLFADEQLLSILQNTELGNTHWQGYKTVSQQDLLEGIRNAGYHDVDAAVAQGSLVFHSSPSLYMHDDNFSTDKMLESLTRSLNSSQATSGNVRLWCDALYYAHAYLDTAKAASFYEFEHKLSYLHEQIPRSSVLCCYDRRLFSAPFLQRVFATHPIISIGTKYYKHNMYYISDNFLDFFGQAPITPFSELYQSKPALESWLSHLERHRALRRKRDKKRKKETPEPVADKYISSFISNMSHQMNTPLTGILGASLLLSATSLTPEQEEYLECIVQSADHLKNVVSDILDFDQLKRGFSIQKKPVSVRECLYDALRTSGVDLTPAGSSAFPILPPPSEEAHAFFPPPSPSAAGSPVAFVSPTGATREVLPGVYCTVADDVPQFILSDHDRIVQVLANLIHNAIRFTNRQSRHVDITIERVKKKEEREEKALSSSSSTSSLAASLELLPEEFHSPHTAGIFILDEPLGMQQDNPSPALSDSQTHSQPPSTDQSPAHAQSGVSETHAQSACLRVTVRDNGLGVDPLQHASAFSPYFRSDTSLSRTHVGTGMGLSICKMVAGLLGGEMSLESEGKDKGTTITFTINADLWSPSSSVAELSSSFISDPASHPSASPEPSPSTSPSLPVSDILPSPSPSPSPSPEFSPRSPPHSPPVNAFFPYKSPQLALPKVDFDTTGIDKNVRVLLVEDNLMNQKILLRLFGKLGIQPDVASNGDEAVELIERSLYDIVFMDLHMPVCDGFEATKKIQSLPDSLPKPLIYALTASVSVEDRDKCLALGMKGHLPKPLSIRELIAVLKVVSVSD